MFMGIQELVNWIVDPSNLFTILLSLITLIIGSSVSFYIARKYSPKAQPVYQEYAYRIIEEKINILPRDIKIFYGETNVPRLSKYLLIFWNSGHINLDGSSMQQKDPLRLEFDKDSEIYYVTPISPLKPTIDLNFHVEKNIVNLSFNDLEPNEGFNMEILHTGQNPYPKLRGSFRNIQNGPKELGIIPDIKRSPKNETFFQSETVNHYLSPIMRFIQSPLVSLIFNVIVFGAFGIFIIITSMIGHTSIILLFIMLPVISLFMYLKFRIYMEKRILYPKNLAIEKN